MVNRFHTYLDIPAAFTGATLDCERIQSRFQSKIRKNQSRF
ncbi:hypothetical protein OROHE_013284 [Orobanche hederae]